MKKLHHLTAMFASVALLAACGGGGGSGSSPAPAASPTPVDGPIGPVTSVPTPSYGVGSAQLLAFNQVNNARNTCGFGRMAQSAQLDQAATNHTNYMVANATLSHIEAMGQPGFTGVNILDRYQAVGYTPLTAGEDIGPVQNAGDTAADAVRRLLGSPYHLKNVMGGWRDVGFGWGNVAGSDTLTVALGTLTGQSEQAPAGVVTYPCAGITDAYPEQIGGEVPSPLPATPAATWGQPIAIFGDSSLRVTSVSITGPGGTVALQALYGDGQTADPNNYYRNGAAVAIPVALTASTTYNVSINYTVGGAPATRNFAFTTGTH